MATAAAGSYEGEGGAGGKLRRRPFRRAATPYDRPPSAIRNPIEAQRNGWISKLVDPASKLIARSAQRFFSSVFRKRLPAPPTVSEANCESRDAFQEAVSVNPFGAQERVSNEVDNPSNSSDNNGINELEQILKGKTFTRDEIDRLTELLHSRTVDVSAENEKKRSEPVMSQPAASHDRKGFANIQVQENGKESQRLLGGISAPVVSSNVLEKDVATPAQLAKAYMGDRPSKVSPSTLGLHNQAFREDVPLLTNVPFTLPSPNMSLAPRSAVRFASVSGVSENVYLTPRPLGRSAIYSMARTPYSRVHHTATLKGVGSMIDAYAGPSTSSQRSWENNRLFGGKQVPKRRSSVLDSDIGSVGPIRRIRQKTNMMAPQKNMSLPTAGSPVSDAAQGSMSLIQKPLLLNEPKHNTTNLRLAENGDNSIPSTSFSSVPSQSSEMARKILQQLDKLVPSPKEKSSEIKLAVAREKTPTKLTFNMLHGQALRSVEGVDSSKLLHNLQHAGTLDGTHLPGAQESISQKQDEVDENGPMKIDVSRDKLAPQTNGVEITMSVKDTVPSVKTVDSAISNFVANPLQKKRAFQMSAHEDFLELDDDSYSGKVALTPLTVEQEQLNVSVVESKDIAPEAVTIEKPLVSSSEIIPPASFILNKGTDTGNSDWPTVAKTDAGFTFSVAPAPSTITQPAASTQPSPLFNGASPPKEPIAAPMFSFGSKSVDKAAPFAFFSTSFGVSESSGLISGAQSESKPETSNSAATVSSTAIETTPKTAESDKGNKDKTQAGDLFRHPENAISSAVSTTTTPSIFCFGASTGNSGLNNGSLASSTSMFSVSAAPVSSSATSITTIAGNSSTPSFSAATPTFSAAPMFQFGSSSSAAAVPSNSASLPSVTLGVESTVSESKTKQASPFGSLPSTSFGALSSSAFTSTSGSVFGFGASGPSSTTTPSSSANNLSQSSNSFGAASGSLFGAQAAPAGTGIAPFAHSMPSQVGSSASPTFGLSGSSTLSSGSSLFGSSTPGSKLFGSSSGFGLNSSTTFSTGASSFSSGSAATSSLFGSSSQSATSSIFGSAFGTSPVAGFSFEASSAAAGPAAGSAPMAFGSSLGASSGSIFSFTGVAATTSAPSLPASSPVFGAPNPVIPFGSASPSNDQMSMEDSMAEDTIQAPAPSVAVFGQPANSPPQSNFLFGSPAPSGGTNLFQFGSQQNPATPQNLAPFQATGNLEFSAGGSFSLGTGDKSNRKIVKVRRDRLRKR